MNSICIGGWVIQNPICIVSFAILCGPFYRKFVLTLSRWSRHLANLQVREVFSSGHAFVSGATHGGRFRLAELLLDLVVLGMSHHLTLVGSIAPVDTFHELTNA